VLFLCQTNNEVLAEIDDIAKRFKEEQDKNARLAAQLEESSSSCSKLLNEV
jgi:hypothetical protein